MKLKQINIVTGLLLFFGTMTSAALIPVDSASALTPQQCINRYQGKSASNTTYNGTNCDKSKGGPCQVEAAGTSANADRYDCNNSLNATGKESPAGAKPGDDCGGVETAFIKCDAKNSGDVEDNGIWALLIIALNILTAGVGIFAVAGIVYGSILYTTAEDKADQVKKATDIITNVVIGLILFALMWAGLNFIVPGGVFA